jgi:S-adenosylmethionine hydrolase
VSIVTLSTDFGTRDAYQAEVKGVLLSEGAPDLRLIDLTHDLAPFDVHAAALFVRSALPRFPRGSIHVVVVDPGVGSARRSLVAEAHGQFLVGPDNGVFGYLFGGDERVHTIDVSLLGRDGISSTFHGRDVFAPAAARLSRGAALASLGPPADGYQRLVFPLVEVRSDVLIGRVIHVDHYGNLITNIADATLRAFAASAPERSIVVHLGERTVRGLVDHYAAAEPGQLLALVGSSGLLEVAVREGNAAEKLVAGTGIPVRVRLA